MDNRDHRRRGADGRRAYPSEKDLSREDYYERYSRPGKIDRPFTRRMQREAEREAQATVPPVEKKPKRKREKRVREARPFPWKRVLIGVGVALALALLALLLFGERGVHHDMPVITPPEAAEETNEG